MNAVSDYYIKQAGNGLSGFSGLRYQRGNGWLSNVWSKVGLPVLKFLGKQALNSGLSIASDALDGNSIKASAKNNLRNSGKNTLDYRKSLVDQSGSGRKRKRRCKKSKTTKRIKASKSVLKLSLKKKQRRRRRRVNRKPFNL